MEKHGGRGHSVHNFSDRVILINLNKKLNASVLESVVKTTLKMVKSLNEVLVKHIVNGSLGELCLVCLAPLEENFFESIFTLICKEEIEFCIADALAVLCQFELDGNENYNCCINCFIAATNAYKFQLQAKRSLELITHYTQELLNNVNNVEITDQDTDKLLCIPLTQYNPTSKVLDINLEGIGIGRTQNAYNEDNKPSTIKKDDDIKPDDKIIVVVAKENSSDTEGKSENSQMTEDDDELFMIINEEKVRKKRDPMVYMKCTKCPVKYRFFSKLKNHVKTEHGLDLYYCKICKILTDRKTEYEDHLKQHSFKYQCNVCNALYKRKEKLEAHMKLHDKPKQMDSEQLENANICEVCGIILEDEASLEEHMRSRHLKRYTCYYCGRHYRAESSFEQHVRKHELASTASSKAPTEDKQADEATGSFTSKQDKSKRSMCNTCGKDFVDERSLLWHQRLHSNDRPYKCQECGRAFVSVNRRNQHALCAHTPPKRRCPLCPALFHLRSMVNTHVKKVHLKTHKRRSRASKHQNVFWKTQAVPIQELSIDVQNDVMELQAAQEGEVTLEYEDYLTPS